MKALCYVTALWLAGWSAVSAQTPTADEMKSDLVGQTMGGRSRCWKFQSTQQIKELTIKSKAEGPSQIDYVVALRLQATNAAAQYLAEARVTYTNTPAGWKLNSVGLLTLENAK